MCSIIGALHNTTQSLIKHRCIMQWTHVTEVHAHTVPHTMMSEGTTSVRLQELTVARFVYVHAHKLNRGVILRAISRGRSRSRRVHRSCFEVFFTAANAGAVR